MISPKYSVLDSHGTPGVSLAGTSGVHAKENKQQCHWSSALTCSLDYSLSNMQS